MTRAAAWLLLAGGLVGCTTWTHLTPPPVASCRHGELRAWAWTLCQRW